MSKEREWLPTRALAASTTATAAFESASTGATTTGPSATAGALLARACFVHAEVAAMQIAAIERRDGAGCFIAIRHLDKGEATRLAGIAITHDVDSFHGPEFIKCRLQVFLRCFIGKISYINI